MDDDASLNRILIGLGAEEVQPEKPRRRQGTHRHPAQGHPRSAGETREVFRLHPTPRRRFRSSISANAPKTGSAADLSRESARGQRGKRPVISATRRTCAKFHEAEPRPEPARSRDGPGDSPRPAAAQKDGPRRRGKLVEIHESSAIQKLIAELARKGLKIEHYADSDKPIFELIEGEGENATRHARSSPSRESSRRSRKSAAAACRSSASKASAK